MVACFVGMVTFTMSGMNKAKGDEEAGEEVAVGNYTSSEQALGYSLIFVTSWIYASNCILNRALKNVHHSVVMFWHGVCGICIAVVGVMIDAWVNAE